MAGVRWTRGYAPDYSLPLQSAIGGPFHINPRQIRVRQSVLRRGRAYLVWPCYRCRSRDFSEDLQFWADSHHVLMLRCKLLKAHQDGFRANREESYLQCGLKNAGANRTKKREEQGTQIRAVCRSKLDYG